MSAASRQSPEHHGRLVNTTGDGLLVEFSSVVDALRCAIEVQARVARAAHSGRRSRLG
jgi:adenylate cyclase